MKPNTLGSAELYWIGAVKKGGKGIPATGRGDS
jgi:hypothetical protein